MKNLNYIFEEENSDATENKLDFSKMSEDGFKKLMKQLDDDVKSNIKKYFNELINNSSDEKEIKSIKELLKYISEAVSESIVLEDSWQVATNALVIGNVIKGVKNAIKHQKTKKLYKDLQKDIEKEEDPDKKKELIKLKGRMHANMMNYAGDPDKKDKAYKEIKNQYKEYKSNKKEEPEEVVKDKSGIEWIKRKKERGDGFTYCRKDDRSVTMSQEEYNKKNAQKNESLGMSLKDFIIESLN